MVGSSAEKNCNKNILKESRIAEKGLGVPQMRWPQMCQLGILMGQHPLVPGRGPMQIRQPLATGSHYERVA